MVKGIFLFGYFFLLPGALFAEELVIRVALEGKPADGAIVCLGSQQEPALYGKLETGPDGSASFSAVPDGLVFITSSLGNMSNQTVRRQPSERLVLLTLTNEKNVSCDEQQNRK